MTMTYFERTSPFAILAACFALLFVPAAVLLVTPNFVPWLPYLVVFIGVGLGATHFFVTLALYLQSRNLDYFASTPRNRAIYFAIPALILIGMALVGAFDVRARYPAFAFVLFAAIRLADFYHVGRQSFGLLQIFKRPGSKALPTWHRPAENFFFVGMALMQWQTYLSDGYFPADRARALVPAVGLGLLFAALAVSYLRAADEGMGRAALIPVAYFAMQAACAAAAVYQTRLYLVALTLHYVEYHLIMGPRCFYAPLDTSRRVDRVSGFLRQRMLLFYALLVAIVVMFEARNHVPSALSGNTLFFVHLFDGIFLLHYFVEAFVWRFGHPFYGKTLGPLYTKPWSSVREAALGSPAPPALGGKSALGLGAVLAVALGAAHLGGGLAAAGDYIERTVAEPIRARHHLHWGMDLARDGELTRAREHLQEVLARDPKNRQARSLLARVEARLDGRKSASR